MPQAYRNRPESHRFSPRRAGRLLAAIGIVASAAQAGPEQEVQLFLKNDSGGPIRGPVMSDAGGLYAVVEIDFVPNVVY